MTQTPSISRIVHYVDVNLDHCAAIITAVGADGAVVLTVFPRGGNPYPVLHVVPLDEGRKATGTWHWPERVGD